MQRPDLCSRFPCKSAKQLFKEFELHVETSFDAEKKHHDDNVACPNKPIARAETATPLT
jgi:hypothetical protein